MKKCYTALVLLILVAMPLEGQAHPCDAYLASPEAKNEDKANVYAAYDFGLKIQDSIRTKDAEALLTLIEGELIHNGPRRSIIKSRPFDEIFPAGWQNAVLAENPECGRIGWRGYMVSRGLVWYEKRDTFPAQYTITGINMLFDENKYLPNKDLPQGWYVDGELVPPQCLPHPFISEDNFESFAAHYKLDVGEFEKEPGKFFGNPIKDLDHLPDEWAVKVIASLDTCGNDADDPIAQEDGSVLSGQMPDAEGYKILGRLDQQECAKLIPNYPVKPEICYAINVTEYMSGTMRHYDNQYIYGLIREKDKNYILPLLSFDSSNDMIDYVEKNITCNLKNTEFCGVWHDSDNYKITITGDKIIYDVYDVTNTCKILKESGFEDGRPFSLLLCDMPATATTSALTLGYLLTYYPKKDWRMSQGSHAQMYSYNPYKMQEISCFSDKKEERDTCNVQELMDEYTGSRIPIYKQ